VRTTEGEETVERGHVLVTGALGGLGTAITRGLAAKGYSVVACDRRGAEAEAWLEGFSPEERSRVMFRAFDVRNLEEVETLRQELDGRGAHVAYLVNNAGIAAVGKPWEMEPKVFDRVVQVNLYGTYHLTRTFCGAMKEAGFGRIVNFASLAAYDAGHSMGSYSAAKAGIIGYTHSVALDLAGSGVTANTIAPGLIWHERLVPTFTDGQRRVMREGNPMKREGEPHEIAETVGFLLSEGAGYITGQTIHVNGGAYMT
jgi:NAD(P)-dependent dehydrogenase (short-subunit alcohol dehydrogenase family)